ncbi:Ger(x)C family spore germination protein [Cohnella thermotolerans]|uniref:Ger(x)C family spore germination protein n=1 Tax=Cohnella thermotolerans TaxID=329858 RepID=UPI000401B39B|nr:Ger(x)C family spore germination protein [Cohnella thermotolerans]
MLRKWMPIVSLLALLLPLTGCWSRHELNDPAIVVGLGIDKAGDGYKVSAQIVNPGQVSSRNGMAKGLPPVVTFTEQGKTVPEALRRMTTKLSKRLYFSHLRIVVFGERMAREGIRKPLDFISREAAMRNDFFLVVAKGCEASDVLGISSSIDPIPANNLYTKLSNSDRLWAATGKITLDKLLIDLGTKGKSPALTGIEIIGNRKTAQWIDGSNTIKPVAIMAYSGTGG